MANVLQFQNRLVSSLSGVSQVPPPDELQPFHLAPEKERQRRCRRVLLEGYALWRKGGISIVDAVREAAAGGAVGHYALAELRRFLLHLDLTAWEQHPARLRADVRSLVRRVAGRLAPHRGGWRVGPPPKPRAA